MLVGQELPHVVQCLSRARREGQAGVLARDATRLARNEGEAFGLVFLDPPYGQGAGELALKAALAGGWAAPGAVVVGEEERPMMPIPGTALLDRRAYGGTAVTLLRVNA